MSRNGSGTYSLPLPSVVTNTTISSTWANTTLSDIATALTGSLAADGQTIMVGNLRFTDASYDIGASGATRPRNLYLSAAAVIGSTLTVGGVSVRGVVLSTQQDANTGSSIDFTSIPAGVRRITVMFSAVSTDGTSGIFVRIGDAGGIEATGYAGTGFGGTTAGFTAAQQTTGLNIAAGSEAAAATWNGTVILTLENAAAFRWTMVSIMGRGDDPYIATVAVSKALSAELDRVSIVAGGSDAFDGAGVINISYE